MSAAATGRDLVIVGGGLAGLAAARVAAERGLDWLLVEGARALGGRVATDTVDGFQIDRGFQVLLTSYPELARGDVLPRLALGRFEPGALVRVTHGARARFHLAVDPWRRPLAALGLDWRHVFAPGDALRVARLRRDCRRGLVAPGGTTRDELVRRGFSARALTRFFEPFWGGVLLDRTLSAPPSFTARLFDAFARGDAAIPERGMRALPEALADGLDPRRLLIARQVAALEPGAVVLVDGTRLATRRALVATDGDEAARLLPGVAAPPARWHATTSCYYATPGPLPAPLDRRLLVLDGDGQGPLHHLAPLSAVAPGLAPPAWGLVVATHDGVADAALEPRLAAELARWFPDTPWRLVAVRPIVRGLPALVGEPPGFVAAGPDRALAGDHVGDRSIDGALRSGRLAAEFLLGSAAAAA